VVPVVAASGVDRVVGGVVEEVGEVTGFVAGVVAFDLVGAGLRRVDEQDGVPNARADDGVRAGVVRGRRRVDRVIGGSCPRGRLYGVVVRAKVLRCRWRGAGSGRSSAGTPRPSNYASKKTSFAAPSPRPSRRPLGTSSLPRRQCFSSSKARVLLLDILGTSSCERDHWLTQISSRDRRADRRPTKPAPAR
jgi:hypothetical protein